MESDRNIADLIRNGGSFFNPPRGLPKDGLGLIPSQTIKQLDELGFTRESVKETKEGHWETYGRDTWMPNPFDPADFSPVNSFLAIYYGSFNDLGGNPFPRTIVLADFPTGSENIFGYFEDYLHPSNIRDTLEALTNGFIEQKGKIGLPKKLNESDERSYNSNKKHLHWTMSAAWLMAYAMDGFFDNIATGPVSALVGTILPGAEDYVNELLLIPAVGQGMRGIYTRNGGFADEKRLKDLPMYAHDFLYGSEAISCLEKQHLVLLEENRKREIYSHLNEITQSTISPDAFKEIYRYMTYSQKVEDLDNNLQKLSFDSTVRFTDVIRAFARPSLMQQSIPPTEQGQSHQIPAMMEHPSSSGAGNGSSI